MRARKFEPVTQGTACPFISKTQGLWVHWKAIRFVYIPESQRYSSILVVSNGLNKDLNDVLGLRKSMFRDSAFNLRQLGSKRIRVED
jgi:hypothetical protein